MSESDLDAQLNKLRIDKSRKGRRAAHGVWLRRLLILAALAAAILTAMHLLAPVKVRVAKAGRQTAGPPAEGTPVLMASGYVIPRKRVEVGSKVIGRVKEIRVRRGEKVHAGDVLLTLEDDDYAAQAHQAEAQLNAAKARLEELRNGARPEEIAASRAAVAALRSTLEGAEIELGRAEKLIKTNAISQDALEKARTARKVAEANARQAEKNAELLEAGTRKEQIAAAEANARQAEANLEFARAQMDYCVIRAPVSGTILEKIAEKGEMITNINLGNARGAKSSAVSMANLDDLQVEIDLNESDLPKATLGQKCEIRLDSNPALVMRGAVDEMSPQADRQKATVQVKVKIIDPAPDIRSDVTARVTFLAPAPAKNGGGAPSSASESVVVAPRAALAASKGAEAAVWVVENGVAKSRKVKTGADTAQGVIITEGLSGGESLVIEPLEKMAEGARVALEEKKAVLEKK